MKSFVTIASWLLRISVVVIIFNLYFNRLGDFDFTSVEWLVSALLVIFSALLVVGAFLKKQTLTVISGMLIAILSAIMIILAGFGIDAFSTHLAQLSIGLYFLGRGNRD